MSCRLYTFILKLSADKMSPIFENLSTVTYVIGALTATLTSICNSVCLFLDPYHNMLQ
jgi:hypothetical protein